MSHFDDVLDVVREIPEGRVTTYGAIADFLSIGAARVVGWALRQSASSLQVPAHRVVNRNGELSGRNHFQTPTCMQELLESEGILVNDNKVVHFKVLFWHPKEILK